MNSFRLVLRRFLRMNMSTTAAVLFIASSLFVTRIVAADQPSFTFFGGDNVLSRQFDLTWWEFPNGCHDENDQGDVYLTDRTFQLYGPNIPADLPLQDVTGVAYSDGSVTIENDRK